MVGLSKQSVYAQFVADHSRRQKDLQDKDMLTPLNVQTITHRTGIAAVVDLGLIPEEVVEMLAARNAVRAAIVPPGDYVLHLDADGMGVRATPISVEHPLADLGDLRR